MRPVSYRGRSESSVTVFGEAIYFIEATGGEAIKIGYTSTEPSRRVDTLQTGNHLKLILLGVIPGPVRIEKKIHRSAGPGDRLMGEWFRKEWALGVIADYADDFIPQSRLVWVDPEVGQFCESGAFVSANPNDLPDHENRRDVDDFHIESGFTLPPIPR